MRRIDKRNDKPRTFSDSLEGLQDSEHVTVFTC